jgi:ATP/maltotriose-dependent transcriptional regulator MalT
MANGFLAAAKGDYVAARAQVSTGLALAKAGGLVELLGRGYLRLATIELEVGDWSAAEAALDRALPRLVDANDGVSGAYVARCLAEIAFHRGDHAGAESLFASAIRQLERLSDLWSIAATRGSKLAPLRFMSGDVDKGLDEIAQALVIARDLDDAYLIHRTITAAISLLPLSAPESLLQILNGLQELRARLDVLEHPWFGIARLPGATSDREPELRAALEGRLDAVSVARAAAAGRRMSAAALADATLELLVARRARASATAVERGTHLPELPMAASQLSTRERQVMTLVAEGLSSRVIATRLEIAETTVKRHVASARRKLGAENRAQAAVLALEQDGP